jgi:acyl carrier protein
MPENGSQVLRHQLMLPQPYITPRDTVEAALAEIWREALHMDRIGVEDDYTDLGGDSYDAAVIFAMIEERLGIHLTLSTLVGAPTVAALACHVARLRAAME